MSGCFYINGISFLAVIIALCSIKLVHSHNFSQSSAIEDLKEGLIFIKNNHLVLVLIVIIAVVSLFGVAHVILMPIFANDVLRVGIRGLGVLMSSAGFGALLGALILARLGDFRHKGRLLLFAAMIFSVSLVVFSLSKAYLLSIIVLVFIGLSSVIAVSLVNTLLQINVEDRFRGRVMSVFMLTFAGMMPFGNLIAGSLAHIAGVSIAVLFGGIICTVLFTVINVAYPALRKLN
jgi:MFS family permease